MSSGTPTTAELFPVRRLLVDLFLSFLFFLFMSFVLRPHVPSNEPFWITLWSCVTAGVITGVFFLALQMFRLVLHDRPAAAKDE